MKISFASWSFLGIGGESDAVDCLIDRLGD